MSKNINKIKSTPKSPLKLEDFLRGIKDGNRVILGKAITLIESTNPDHQQLAENLIDSCLSLAGNSIRIGITGVPGVGKSTFIEALGTYLIDQKGRKGAVLAIDPSSQRNSGSILGDKTRMNKLSINDKAFIRPSPSAGALGGVAKATRETIILCEAAGYDTVLIETVGVGQSEIEAKSMVDFFLLLMLAGAGDELQGIKRGIMEIADGVVINKADGDNIEQAQAAIQNYQNAIHLFPQNENGWIPEVTSCSVIEHRNIDAVWAIVEKYSELTIANGSFSANRKLQAKFWLKHAIESSIKEQFYANEVIQEKLKDFENKVSNGEISPFHAATELLKIYNS
jgi:LAO/AO transport system kinase